MSERRAVILTMVAMILVAAVVCAGVIALGGNDDLVVLSMVLMAILGANQVARVVMSYESKDRR